jgi:hypothetical protein
MLNQMTANLDQMIIMLIPPWNQIAKWNQFHKLYNIPLDFPSLPPVFFSLGNINNMKPQDDAKARNGRATRLG